MNEITLREYKKAIIARFEAKKSEGVYGSGSMSNISPAQLRDLCWRISEMGLTKTDESTFRFFFNANGDEKLAKAINNFNTGKLKSVISFLKGEKNSENTNRIELAAIIVDFNPRPFKKFSQNREPFKIDDESFPEDEDDEVDCSKTSIGLTDKKTVIVTDNQTKKKIIIISIAFIALFFIGNTVKNIFFPAKECMQWKENHYEAVDCLNDKLGIGQLNLIIPLDENICKMVKLNLETELVFFRNEKPLVWYSKNNGQIELFNQPGFHPETGKPLKPITRYIIETYQLKSKE